MPAGLSERPAAVIYELDSILERIDLARMFPTGQPLEVELGCGDGSFLAEYAQLRRGVNFIGTERLLGRIRKLQKKAGKVGLTNVRGVRIESWYFLRYLLPAHAASALHIYFPDPWPKRRHERHRLINDEFPAVAAQALADQGIVFLRTDDRPYFEQMRTVFGSRQFELVETPAELAAVWTNFERDFQARGVKTLRAAYRLKQR